MSKATLKPLAVRPGEARRLLGVGKTKLYEMINDGTLKTTVVGRCRLIRYASIEALINGGSSDEEPS